MTVEGRMDHAVASRERLRRAANEKVYRRLRQFGFVPHLSREGVVLGAWSKAGAYYRDVLVAR